MMCKKGVQLNERLLKHFFSFIIVSFNKKYFGISYGLIEKNVSFKPRSAPEILAIISV